MTDNKKDPWQKLRGTRSLEQKEYLERQSELAESKGFTGGYTRTKKPNVPFWSNEINLSTPTRLRLVPGQYTIPKHIEEETKGALTAGAEIPNFVWMMHRIDRVASFREVWDTRDIENGNDLALYGESHWSWNVRSQITNVYNAVDYGTWHTIPSKTNSGYLNWSRCGGDGCEQCAQGADKSVGRAGYVSLGEMHEQDLRKIGQYISKFCRCGSPHPLQAFSLSCGRCQTDLYIAPLDERGSIKRPITKQFIYSIYDSNPECPICNVVLTPFPKGENDAQIVENLVCEQCDSPERASIFDADLALHKEKKDGEKYARLLLQENAFKGAGFQIRPPSQTLLDMAPQYDFIKGLGINLTSVSKKLGIRDDENPFFVQGKGYKERE